MGSAGGLRLLYVVIATRDRVIRLVLRLKKQVASHSGWEGPEAPKNSLAVGCVHFWLRRTRDLSWAGYRVVSVGASELLVSANSVANSLLPRSEVP